MFVAIGIWRDASTALKIRNAIAAQPRSRFCASHSMGRPA